MRDVLSIRIGLKWGVILGVSGMILNAVIYQTNFYKQLLLNFILLSIIFIAVIFLAFFEFKKADGMTVSFKQAILIGVLLFSMSGLLVASFDIVYKETIDPALIEKQMGIFIERNEALGLSKDWVEMTSNISNFWMTGRYGLMFVTFNYLLLGLVYTVLIYTFMPKK